jgi:hypothetical protein
MKLYRVNRYLWKLEALPRTRVSYVRPFCSSTMIETSPSHPSLYDLACKDSISPLASAHNCASCGLVLESGQGDVSCAGSASAVRPPALMALLLTHLLLVRCDAHVCHSCMRTCKFLPETQAVEMGNASTVTASASPAALLHTQQ